MKPILIESQQRVNTQFTTTSPMRLRPMRPIGPVDRIKPQYDRYIYDDTHLDINLETFTRTTCSILTKHP